MRAILPLLLLLCLTSCFDKRMEYLKWDHIENPAITDFKYKVESFPEGIRILSSDSNGSRLRVVERPIPTAEFTEYVKNTRSMLQGFFKEFESPYPAPLSQKVVCSEDLKPRSLSAITTADRIQEGLLLFANSRYTYGDCDTKQLLYQTLHAFIHCPQANLSYEIKYFLPKSQASEKILESIYNSMKCK